MGMGKKLSIFLLKLFGWKVNFNLDPIPDKFIIAVIPHTSNWDFPLGLFTRSIMGVDSKFIAKQSLFKWPLGGIFKWLGGYPVDRSQHNNFVDTVIDVFNREEKFSTAISPEGTRKRVHKLKTGFYYIAKGAGVPILLCRFDYGNKRVDFSEPFYTTDDKEADFQYIESYFKGVVGKIPENGYMYGE
jgi:1-acyl-sn-glycerol-3-phosphate acyltransferase